MASVFFHKSVRMSALAALFTAAAAPALAADAGAHAQDVLSALQEMTGVPGMAAAVWRDGEIIWTGEAGAQDAAGAVPVSEDTTFRLASVSKVFAATAAARLAAEGKLDLDAPVGLLVDGLNPEWPAITPRQLAAHISGIPHYQAIDENRGGRRFASVKESLGVFASRDLLFAPGTSYNYSSYGFTLLSAAVEAAAGEAYLDYLGDALTAGLDIGPDSTDSGDPLASEAFDYRGGALAPSEPHDYSYSWGGAGLSGSARDVALFGGRVLSGDILPPDAFRSMITPAKLNNGEDVSERDYKLGLGWRVSADASGETMAHHAGVTLGARSTILLYPERKMSVSLLSNAEWVASIEATAATLAAAFDDEAGEKPAPRCPTGAARYEGFLGDQTIEGTARFIRKSKSCRGEISISGEAAAWLNGFPQGDADTLKIIAFDRKGGFSRGAIVTPIGAFEIADDETANAYAGVIGSRPLAIRLSAD